MMKTKLRFLAGILALILPPLAMADLEQARETEGHIIYYNVLPTSALPEAMARAYGITRSESRVLLNVTVRTRDDDGGQPVQAAIDAQAVSLTGHLKRFEMRELSEEGVIYYIGDIRVGRGENLKFEIEVTPEGEERPERIEFRRSF